MQKKKQGDHEKKLQGEKVGSSSIIPGDNSSVQNGEPSQTANTSIDNQDNKKDDLVAANDNHDKPSSPNDKVPQEPLQTTTLDGNKNDNTSKAKLKETTNEPDKSSTTPFLGPSSDPVATRASPSNENTSSQLDAQTTATNETSSTQVDPVTTRASPSNENTSSQPDAQTTATNETSSTQVNPVTTRASPSNENNSSQLDAQTTATNETSNTQVPNSNANTQSTSVPTDDHMNSLPNAEPSTTKTLDSDATKPTTSDLPKSSTSMDPTSNQDSNSANQTNPLTTNSDTKEATNQSAETGQQSNNGSSTSQIPDLDANKQPNTVPTDDPPKSSTVMAPTSNQDSNVVDQANPPKADNDTKQPTNQSTKTASTDSQTKDSNENPVDTNKLLKSSNTMAPNQDPNSADQTNSPKEDDDAKKGTNQSVDTDSPDQQIDKKKSSSDADQLRTLIDQEIKLVKENCPKLGQHGNTIKEEVNRVSERFKKLKEEPHGIKELKTIKRTLTKLKLQIPTRYITYDDTEKQKKQHSVESSDDIPTKLQKDMPRLHNKLFHESSVCNSIHLRFNELRPELKLCLLCFTVFPENATISRRSMIYWWIGEGLISGEEDTVEEKANGIFNELITLGFIEAVSKRPIRHVANCKMNTMVRAALVMIADKVKFFDFDEYGNPKDFGKFDEIESPEDMPGIYPLGEPKEFFHFYDKEGNEITETIKIDDSCQFVALPSDGEELVPRDVKKLIPRDGEELVTRNGVPINKRRMYYFYERKKVTTKSYKVCLMGSGLSKGIPWENLHMLFNVQDVILDFKPEWFLRMKNLNVLFLGKWQSSATHHIEVEEVEFFKSFDYMNNVRFFTLQGVSRISVLPDSISKLKSLLVLDLRSCNNLEEIPETIGELKCLTHLDMSECYLLRKIPKEISSLKSLQVLKGFVVVETPGKDMCTLHDLRRLENLRKLSLYTHMKNFPDETHLDSLQKIETLRKLSILWGGHESTPTTDMEKQVNGNHKKHDQQPKLMGFIPKKQWVQGNMRRMNAFNNSTLGMRLTKLDLKCFPHSVTPHWLTAGNLQGLKKLYIRGGKFSDLGQYQEMFESDNSLPKETWNVEILRLKYLEELNLEWRELHNLFPKLKSLEKVKCPRLSLFPCNEKGVWMKKGLSAT